jgi:hypothetical protein
MIDGSRIRSLSLPPLAAAALLAAASGLALSAPVAAAGPGFPTSGPDVTINLLDDVESYGVGGGVAGYSVGTTSCNIGDQNLNWCDNGGCPGDVQPDQHPVIAQGLYRLKDGRLTQIGMSWLKHGFLATNTTEGVCKTVGGCISPGTGDLLGPGCRDTYWASLNGGRPLGPRSEVNATTGEFPFPHGGGGTTTTPGDQRIRVATADVDPAQNAGALYWVEGQYVADNDALAGNGLNNASHRSATVAANSSFTITPTGSVVRERSAIHAWKAADGSVEIHHVDVASSVPERFEVARKVTQVDGDTWHYEFAIRNMNSDRAARAFTVDFADGTSITGVGFRDIDHHSGEPYSTADWTPSATQATGTVTWSTETFQTNPNANALRWATMFNFWFDADVAPGAELHTLELFKPAFPAAVSWEWPLFADGFEAHNLVAWSSFEPRPTS